MGGLWVAIKAIRDSTYIPEGGKTQSTLVILYLGHMSPFRQSTNLGGEHSELGRHMGSI